MTKRVLTAKKKNKRDPESGIILIVVIIVVSILTILVTDLIYFTQIDSEISSNARDEIKARYIAKSGIHVAAGTLKKQPFEELSDITGTLTKQGEPDDNFKGFWAINVPYFPVGQGGVSVTVIDERAKINLNMLVNTKTNRIDQQVLLELKELFRFLEIDQSKSDRFISSLINWTDSEIEGSDNDQDPSGANASFYAGQENPYIIKNGKLDSVQEARMIDGMDEDFFQTVKDYITVYPPDKKVNFSTAPKVVLMAAIKGSAVSAIEREEATPKDEITDDMAEQIADEIIAAREDEPIIRQKKAREIATDIDPTSQISAGLVGVSHSTGKSETFSIKAVGILGESNPTRRIIEAVLKKSTSNDKVVVDIVSWKEL